MTEQFDIFNFFQTFNNQPTDTKQLATLDYIKGRIDSDTYLKRMAAIDGLGSKANRA